MANFYLNANGSNTAPYDTPAKGATNPDTLQDSGLVVNGDTVFVCSDLPVGYTYSNWVANITLKSINNTKYNIGANATHYIGGSDQTTDIIIDGLRMYYIWPPFPNACRNLIIRNCIIDQPYQISPSFSTPVCGYLNLIIENNIIRERTIRVSFPVGYIPLSPTSICNIIIKNNVFDFNLTSTDIACSFMYVTGGAFPEGSTMEISNNIFYNRVAHSNLYAYQLDNTLGDAITFKNNNLYNGGSFYSTSSQTLSPTQPDATNTKVDPKFVNWAKYNYYLLKTSALYNTGYNNKQVGIGEFSLTNEHIFDSTNDYTHSYGTGTVTDGNTYQLPTVLPRVQMRPNTELYNQSLDYVINNRNYLKPYSAISDPPNPGDGYPSYVDYETDLFGITRNGYVK